MMGFDEVWDLVQHHLRVPTTVHNWTKDSGAVGDDFSAQATPDGIVCRLPTGSRINVPKSDVQRVYALWDEYLAGYVKRSHLRDKVTRHSKYIISVLHQLLDGV